MSKPAFIVEGKTEQKIIQSLCNDRYPVKLLRKNGKCVSLPIIAERISLIAESFNNRNYPIIVLVDREDRKISAVEMAETIRNFLSQHVDDTNDYIIGVPDLMIENWIIPFIDNYGNMTTTVSNHFESKKCIGQLEKRLSMRGVKYDKVVTGTELFCKINPANLAEESESFKLFYNQAKEHCWWLRDSK